MVLIGLQNLGTYIINSKFEKNYEFKFERFKMENYVQQIPQQEDGLQWSEVRQQEGSELLSYAGSPPQIGTNSNESGRREVAMASSNYNRQQIYLHIQS